MPPSGVPVDGQMSGREDGAVAARPTPPSALPPPAPPPARRLPSHPGLLVGSASCVLVPAAPQPLPDVCIPGDDATALISARPHPYPRKTSAQRTVNGEHWLPSAKRSPTAVAKLHSGVLVATRNHVHSNVTRTATRDGRRRAHYDREHTTAIVAVAPIAAHQGSHTVTGRWRITSLNPTADC